MKFDTSVIDNIDKEEDELEDAYYDELVKIGQGCIRVAQYSGAYKNHTFRLRSAPGYCVVRDGEIYKMEVGSTKFNKPEAIRQTESILIYSEKPEDGLYLADGMEYASYVESKGYDVMDSAISYGIRQVKKQIG